MSYIWKEREWERKNGEKKNQLGNTLFLGNPSFNIWSLWGLGKRINKSFSFSLFLSLNLKGHRLDDFICLQHSCYRLCQHDSNWKIFWYLRPVAFSLRDTIRNRFMSLTFVLAVQDYYWGHCLLQYSVWLLYETHLTISCWYLGNLQKLQISILVTERVFTAYNLYSITPDLSSHKNNVFRFFWFIIFTLSVYKNSEYTLINNSSPFSGFSNFLAFIDTISSRWHFIHTPSYALFISNVKSMTNSSFTLTKGGEPVFPPLLTSNFWMWISVWLVDITLCYLVRRNLQW